MAATATRFDSFVALATRLVDKNGRAITVRTRGGATFKDPTQPWLGRDATFTTTDGTGVFLSNFELTSLIRNLDLVDAFHNVARDSSGLLVDAATVSSILVEDTIADGSNVWSVRKAEVIQPGAVPILWILEIAK